MCVYYCHVFEFTADALDDFGKTIPPSRDTLPPPQDDITDGLASEMESCLHEATQLLSDHNPELMKEFEKLFSQAASAGMFPQQPSTAQASQSNASIEDTLEQTFQQMKQNKPQKVIIDHMIQDHMIPLNSLTWRHLMRCLVK